MLKLPHFNFSVVTLGILLSIAITIANLPPDFYNAKKSFLFGEFIQSNNFGQLIADNLNLFSPRVGGGTYNYGLPVSQQNENVYGTNRGFRILPLLIFLNALRTIFGNFWDRVYFIVVLFAPLIMFLIASYFYHGKKMNIQSIAAAFFYSFNPWIIQRINTGFWQLHLAYSVMPIFIFTILQSYKKKHSLKVTFVFCTIASISATIMWLFQPHFIVIIALMLFVFLINIYAHKIKLNNWAIIQTILTISFFLIFNAFNLLPALFGGQYTLTRNDIFSLGSVGHNGKGSTVYDVLNLIPRSPNVTETTSHDQNIFFSFHTVFILFAVFVSFLRAKKINSLALFIITYLILLFLSKGLNEPATAISRFIYDQFFFMHAFRDPSRFYAGIALLFSITLSLLPSTKYTSAAMALYIIYILFSFNTQFSTIPLAKWLHNIPYSAYYEKNKLTDDKRVLYWSNGTGINFEQWYNVESGSTYSSPYEALVPSKSNLATYSGSNDTYFSQMILFAMGLFEMNSPATEAAFQRLNIGLFTKPSSILVENYPEMNEVNHTDQHLNQAFSSRTNPIMPKKNDGSFSPATPIFVLGEPNQFVTANFLVSAQNPIIYLNQPINAESLEYLNDGNNKPHYLITDIDDYEKYISLNSLSKYSLHLDQVVKNYDKDWQFYMPYSSNISKSGYMLNSGKAISTNKKGGRLLIEPNVDRNGQYYVAINVLNGIDYGPIKLVINNNEVAFNELPSSEKSGFLWVTAKSFIGKNSTLELISLSDKITIIDEVLVIPQEVFERKLFVYKEILNNNFQIRQSKDFFADFPTDKHKIDHFELETNSYAINTNSKWLHTKIPYNDIWTTNNKKIQNFISDGYALSIFSEGGFSNENLSIKSEPFLKLLQRISILWLIFCSVLSTYFTYTYSKHLKYKSGKN